MTHLPPPSTQEVDLDSLLRVNLAGERGAVAIYEGQRWALRLKGGSSASHQLIETMLQQEKDHAALFTHLSQQYHIRPTLFDPLWRVLGWSMGAITGLIGDKEAMACTAAVEKVIEDHYAQQIHRLPADSPLRATLLQCQEDEIAHKKTALEHGAMDASPCITQVIMKATRLAIWLSKRW